MFIYGSYDAISVSGKFISDFSCFSAVIRVNLCRARPSLFLLELLLPIVPSSSNKSNKDDVVSNFSSVRL